MLLTTEQAETLLAALEMAAGDFAELAKMSREQNEPKQGDEFERRSIVAAALLQLFRDSLTAPPDNNRRMH